jgi:prephenate dehydrogenase
VFPNTLGVIGLGAVGGSVAWHAVRAGVPRVLGCTRDPKDAAAAARAGAVTEIVHDPISILQSADFVVLAAPHDAVLASLREGADLLRGRAVICTDVASVKTPIVDEARRLGLTERFAGSHPLVWFERGGFGAAHPERLRERIVYVTPASDTGAAGREVADFWERVVGAHPVMVNPDRHDQVVAWTQLLPAAAAAALARVLAEHRPSGATLGPAALDATAPADRGVPQLVEALMLNEGPVLEALAALGESFGELAELLRAGDADGVTRWLGEAAEWRGRYRG